MDAKATPTDTAGFQALEELALDMRSSWNHATDRVWRALDPELWELTHNPWVVRDRAAGILRLASDLAGAGRPGGALLARHQRRGEHPRAPWDHESALRRWTGAAPAARAGARHRGWRLLTELGTAPEVCHLNEGHAAFAVLEGARGFIREAAQPFDVALAVTRAGNLFTTHTAVAAGFDRFAPDLIESYLGTYARHELGATVEAAAIPLEATHILWQR